jgi:methanethiol S-methyltransferase
MTLTEEISHDVRRFAVERGVSCGLDPDYRPANAPTPPPATKPNFIVRLVALLYGLVSYVVFSVTFLYAIGFVSGLAVPKTIDTGTVVPLAEGLIVNLFLMSVFAIQHSAMARKQFKRWWTQFVPKSVERSTYVLFASLALNLLFWQWRPMPAVVWHIDNPQIAMAAIGLSSPAGSSC